MGQSTSLDDTSIPEKLSLLSEEEATINTPTKRWSHHSRATCRMVFLTLALLILSPLAFIYPSFLFRSQGPAVTTGRCIKLEGQSIPLLRCNVKKNKASASHLNVSMPHLKFCTIFLPITRISTLVPILKSSSVVGGVTAMIFVRIKVMLSLAQSCQRLLRLCCAIFSNLSTQAHQQ